MVNRMRLELALIVGIVFFCSWCAYIVVKMNAGHPGSFESQNYTSAVHQRAQPPPPPPPPQLPRLAVANSPAVYFLGPQTQQHHHHQPQHQQQQHQQQQQQPLQQPIAAVQRPPYSNPIPASQPDLYGYSASRWQPPPVQPYPTASLVQAQYRPQYQSQPVVQAPSVQQQMAYELGQAELELEPETAVDQVEGEQDEEESEPAGEPHGRELDQRSGERTYTEDDEQSSERDQHGRPTNVRRRHLINGRPVEPDQEQKAGTDFNELVDEIEDETSQAPQSAAEEGETPGESSPRRSLAPSPSSPDMKTSNPAEEKDVESEEEETSDEQLPESKKDSHEHQLRESLKSQQWDDDSNGTTSSPDEMAADASRQPTDVSSSDDPSGPEEIEFRDLDRLTSAARFPFMETNSDEPSPGGIRLRKRRDLGNSSAAPASETANKLQVTDLLASAQDQSIQLIKPAEVNQSHLVPGADQHIAVMEMPPPPLPPPPVYMAPTDQEIPPLEVGHLAAPSQSINETVQNIGDVTGPQYYSPSPSQHHLQQASNHAVKKSKKKMVKKKKKKMKTKTKSKMVESKYKAAKAHASKKRSKVKKGARQKKKKKNNKVMSKKQKEFKGATKGSKVAKGKGARGAKKGVLYYKDKGYKKKGFKRAYQKVESGDHKTYFDEFRDKDHKKKWKNFKDKHEYMQSKKWAGKDKKKFNNYGLNENKDKKSGSGIWAERAHSRYRKDYKHNAAKAKKSANKKKRKMVKVKKMAVEEKD